MKTTPLLAALALVIRSAQAQDHSLSISKVGEEFWFTGVPAIGYYFNFQGTPDLAQPFRNIGMTLGEPVPIYRHLPELDESSFYVLAEAISVFAPRDTDHDGMDDIYEMGHGLNPIDPSDAGLPSPNLAGITNLEEYRLRFGYNSAKPQFYSREVSTFNYGAAREAAVSREHSVFNFGGFNRFDSVAREISVFNGEHFPIAGYPEIYSREQSVFNFGATARYDAVAREMSVFNGERPPVAGFPQIYSREVGVFNFGAPTASVEAVSRELSIFNDIH